VRVAHLRTLLLRTPHLNPLPCEKGEADCSGSQCTRGTFGAQKSFTSQRSCFRCFILRMKRFLILHVFSALLVTMAEGATNFDLAAKATN